MMKCTFKIQFYTDKIQNMDRISSEKYFHSMKCIFLWNNDFKPPRQISYSYRLLKQSLYDSGFIRDHVLLSPRPFKSFEPQSGASAFLSSPH